MAEERTSYREVLRHRVSGRLAAAAAISAIGDYVGVGALLLLAFERSGGRVIGSVAVFAVQAFPALLTGGLAGGWLDRLPRRGAMAGLQLGGVAALLVPLLLPGLVPVLVAAAMLGGVRAGFGSTRSGAIAEAVPEEQRGGLLALIGFSDQASQVIGYLSGATVAVTFGPAPALLADAGTFAVAAVVLMTVPLPPGRIRDRTAGITAGIREIWRSPTLRLVAPLVWITGLVSALPESLAPGVAGVGEEWVPVLMAAAPAGQAVTMAVLGRRREIERVDVQLTHLAALALAFGLAVFADGPVLFALTNVAVGAGVAWVLGPQTLFVRLADPSRMAQVTGTMIALLIVAEGVGTLGFGVLADRTSVTRSYWVAGLLILAAAVLGWFRRERAGRDAAVE